MRTPTPRQSLVCTVAALIGASGGLGVAASAAPTAGAASVHSAMTVTETGKITQFDSASSFTIAVGTKRYVVKTDAMTHVTIDSKHAKLSALKKGDTVSAKGSVEMNTITATSVTEQM